MWRVGTGDRLGESPPRPLPCLLTQRANQHANKGLCRRRRRVASFSLRGCAFLCVTAAAAAAIAELVSSYGNKCKRIMSREGRGWHGRWWGHAETLAVVACSLPCSGRRRRCETDVQFASLFLFHLPWMIIVPLFARQSGTSSSSIPEKEPDLSINLSVASCRT